VAHRVLIYDVIGWWVTAEEVVNQLDTIALSDDQDVDLHINSGGGYVDHAVAIYNRLKMHPGNVRVFIDGLAASAATIIMMAGDSIIASQASMLMVHKPWSVAIGDADDMRKSAEVLDITESSMLALYAKRTGMDIGELAELLAEETWMNGEDAKAFGFVDIVADFDELEDADDEEEESEEEEEEEEEMEAAALIDTALLRYREARKEKPELPQYRTAAALRRRIMSGAAKDIEEKGREFLDSTTPDFTDNTESTVTDKKKNTNGTGAPASDDNNDSNVQALTEKEKRQAMAEERARINAIDTLCAQHGIDDEKRSSFINEGTTLGDVREKILNALVDGQEEKSPGVAQGITVGRTEGEGRAEGIQRTIEARLGILEGDAKQELRSSEYASMSLAEMAMEFAPQRAGSRHEIIGKVLAMRHGRPQASGVGITHTTSDYTSILENIANKMMLQGWNESPATWRPWTNRGVLSDFKASSRVGLGLFSDLAKVEEGGEYKGAKVSERGVTIQLGTYGRVFGITRQAIINDDLQAFTRLPRLMGQASERTIANFVYAHLTNNDDVYGSALFAGGRNNTHAVDFDTAGVTTMKSSMRTQTDDEHSAPLNITPRFALLPAALETDAMELINGQIIADGGAGVTNVLQGSLEPIIEPRLDADDAGTSYLAGDPAMHDTIEVAFLDGNDAPYLEQTEAWNVDGAQFKVRIDFGTAIRDYRALQRATGA